MAPEAQAWSAPTPLETRYAEIRAWRMAVGARHDVEGLTPALLDENRSKAERPQLPGKPPLCPGKVEPNGALEFPLPAISRNSYDLAVGAGMVRLQIDQNGAVTNSVVLAAVPRPEFLRALAAPGVKWSFVPDQPTPAGCRLASNDFVLGVVFRPTP